MHITKTIPAVNVTIYESNYYTVYIAQTDKDLISCDVKPHTIYNPNITVEIGKKIKTFIEPPLTCISREYARDYVQHLNNAIDFIDKELLPTLSTLKEGLTNE